MTSLSETAMAVLQARYLGCTPLSRKHVDAAVSKTVNLPTDASPQAVREIFLTAHELRLKGVTVYRYGSRLGETLNIVDDSETPDCQECSV